MSGQRGPGQQAAGHQQHGQRPGAAQDDRPGPGREQAGQVPPRGQLPGRAEAARGQREQESGHHGLRRGRGGQRGGDRQRQRPGDQRVRHGQRDRGVADVPQAEHAAAADHPPAGPPQQRAGQQHQAEREQPDPAGPAQREPDVVADQPDRARRAEYRGQPGPGVRRGHPADRGQQGQDGQAGAGRRGRGQGAGQHQRAGPVRGPRHRAAGTGAGQHTAEGSRKHAIKPGNQARPARGGAPGRPRRPPNAVGMRRACRGPRAVLVSGTA